jgi:hypothetical protein
MPTPLLEEHRKVAPAKLEILRLQPDGYSTRRSANRLGITFDAARAWFVHRKDCCLGQSGHMVDGSIPAWRGNRGSLPRWSNDVATTCAAT